MKLFVIILASLFSSFMKIPDPPTETVCGIWKGYFGTEHEINSITIKINPQNKAEIFYNYSGQKMSATYRLVGNSSIIISAKSSDQASAEVILEGNLNRTSSFIDGRWDAEGRQGGCFYLQKQFTGPNY